MSTPFTLTFAFALFMMIALPVLLAFLVVRARRLPVRVPLVAAGFYFISLAITLPLTAFAWPLAFGRGSLLTLALTCLTWGVCEELARFASFRFVPVMQRHRDDSGALAAGLGHGGAESIIFGLQFGAGVALMTLFPQQLPAGAGQQALSGGPVSFVLLGLDRLPALAAHLAFAFLIVMAFRRGLKYLPIAIVAHTLLDFVVFSIQKYFGALWFEAVFGLLGAAALILVALLLRHQTIATQDEEPPPTAA
ncbi:MAG: YhfC family intramembrane metalloprotease [Propionibacteriaceae bacterium]|nr:YhfC family intramembrane metalloprotease [Propionibacteriaceae bacterium]